MIAWILITLMMLIPIPVVAETAPPPPPPPAPVAAPKDSPNHAVFDRILRAHVKRGRVNYGAIKARDRGALEAYVKSVATANLKGLKRRERLSFYLNAYNALVIKSVVDRLPLRSVKKVKGFFDGARHKVAGRSISLNGLENKIIRPRFKEPRIHFALVCAARSCPPLMARAFKAKTLNRDLTRLTRSFLKSRAGLVIEGGKVKASKLFTWYADDFVKAAGSVPAYLAKYRPEHAALLAQGGLKIGFLEYDWALNGP